VSGPQARQQARAPIHRSRITPTARRRLRTTATARCTFAGSRSSANRPGRKHPTRFAQGACTMPVWSFNTATGKQHPRKRSSAKARCSPGHPFSAPARPAAPGSTGGPMPRRPADAGRVRVNDFHQRAQARQRTVSRPIRPTRSPARRAPAPAAQRDAARALRSGCGSVTRVSVCSSAWRTRHALLIIRTRGSQRANQSATFIEQIRLILRSAHAEKGRHRPVLSNAARTAHYGKALVTEFKTKDRLSP